MAKLWPLFPRTWFSSKDPQSKDRARVTQWLYKHWRVWLRNALARVLNAEVAEDAAPRLLATLKPKDWLSLDQALRYGAYDLDLGRPDRGPVLLAPVEGTTPEVEAYLFTAACDANGFIREQALTSFARFPGRMAMIAALIRSDDWVHEVRAAAVALIEQTMSRDEQGECLFDHLELLLSLRDRRRFAVDIWPRWIEPVLLDPRHSEARWHGILTGNGRARLFSFELIAGCDLDRLPSARMQAIADPAPPIAQWALAATKSDDVAFEAKLLDKGLAHPHASIRAEALRQSCALDLGDTRALLEKALFDPSHAPRRAAAFLLRRDHGVDPLAIWRTALDAGESPQARVALAAMQDEATVEDEGRLLRWLDHRAAACRGSAVAALCHAAPEDLRVIVRRALCDPSLKVVRQALIAFRLGLLVPDTAMLDTAWRLARNNGIRAALVATTHRLGKWESLEQLLDWSQAPEPVTFGIISVGLGRWMMACGRRFTPMDAFMKSRLPIALERAQASHPEYSWHRLESELQIGLS